tara:strand:- start:6285 stop:6437 length:153 start_codon:yes stop_codon:yes gene_type:complete
MKPEFEIPDVPPANPVEVDFLLRLGSTIAFFIISGIVVLFTGLAFPYLLF